MLCKIRKAEHGPVYDDLKFLIAAVPKLGGPNCTNRIFVDSGGDKLTVVATDANSLHTVELELLEGMILEPGDYDLIKADSNEIVLYKQEFEEKFPDWRKIMNFKKVQVFDNFEIISKGEPSAIYRICKADFCINFERLHPLVGGGTWNVYTGNNKQVLLFKRQNRQVLIMCIRVGDQK